MVVSVQDLYDCLLPRDDRGGTSGVLLDADPPPPLAHARAVPVVTEPAQNQGTGAPVTDRLEVHFKA